MTTVGGEIVSNPELEDSYAPTDQELAHASVIAFFGEDSRYPDHNEYMIQKLEEYDLYTPGIETAVAIHDIIDHGIVNFKDQETRSKAVEILNNLYDQVDNKNELIYAIGCAISASKWESDIGKGWVTGAEELFADRPEDEKQQIRAAIEKDKAVKIENEILKKSKINLVDTTSLRQAATERDIEGLIINAVRLLHNLQNPPPDNTASTWRDCNEVLSCYAPALELFGFKDIASELRGQAYEFFYDDPLVNKNARHQRETSLRYKDQIDGAVNSVINKALGSLAESRENFEKVTSGSRLENRVKSEGSIRRKLSVPDYLMADHVPDGIGYKLVVTDLIGDDSLAELCEVIKSLITIGEVQPQITAEFDEITEADIALIDESTREVTDSSLNCGRFICQHVLKGHPPIENYVKQPKKSGYKSIHLSFQYLVDGEIVPFEIQVLTEEHDRHNTYRKASHVLYKAGMQVNPSVIEDLKNIEYRARLLKDKQIYQELNVHTWFDYLELIPEMETPIHRMYEYTELGSARILAPKELSSTIQTLDSFEFSGNIILPPNNVSKEDFYDLIDLVDPSFGDNYQIKQAIDYLSRINLPKRRDGTDQLQGHLLPAALHGIVISALLEQHWEREDPSEYLSDKLLGLLFHDYIEDVKKGTPKSRARYIRKNYGEVPTMIAETLTSPSEIIDDHERRITYANRLSKNPEALLCKISDRMQNHTVDLIRLARSKPAKKETSKIAYYFNKTKKYLSNKFMDKKTPDGYKQIHLMVMRLAEKLSSDFEY